MRHNILLDKDYLLIIYFERYERFNERLMLKKINYFILLIFFFEIVSLFTGYGTHYEYHKYGLMCLFLLANTIFLFKKKLPVTQRIRNKRN